MVQTFRRLDVWAEEFEKSYAVAEYILSTQRDTPFISSKFYELTHLSNNFPPTSSLSSLFPDASLRPSPPASLLLPPLSLHRYLKTTFLSSSLLLPYPPLILVSPSLTASQYTNNMIESVNFRHVLHIYLPSPKKIRPLLIIS